MNLINKTQLLPLFILGNTLGMTYALYKNNYASEFIKDKKIVSDTKKKKNVKFQEKEKLYLINTQDFYQDVVNYLYDKYGDKIHKFTYNEEKIYTYSEYRNRRKEKPLPMKILFPIDNQFKIQYEMNDLIHDISIEIRTEHTGHGAFEKLLQSKDCSTYETILQSIILISDRKDVLIHFVDAAKSYQKEKYLSYRKTNQETLCIYYFRRDYWSLLSKTPKRKTDTIYLQKDMKEDILQNVKYFFSEEARDDHLSFGIPYKNVKMIYGPPGTGKTSLIKSICSELDCDLYILPITKDMVDSDLMGAFIGIDQMESSDERKKVIVIEDIDTLFDERKDGDTKNGITLQCFLNCMDGFTCLEGTLLFITANKPEVLDYALLRSCRIDEKIKLDYADKYQTEQMFIKYIPSQITSFDEFYDSIKHKEYTTAILQEFLFHNRNKKNILDHMHEFNSIIERNDPKNYELIKEEKNFYS